MSVESVTQAVSGLALAFSDQDDATYAMVYFKPIFLKLSINKNPFSKIQLQIFINSILHWKILTRMAKDHGRQPEQCVLKKSGLPSNNKERKR